MPNKKSPKPTSTPAGRARRDGKDGPQIVRTGRKRWSDAAEKCFLDHLGASSNVSLSASEVGFSREAIYKRRRNDPVFYARWMEALEQGYARVEMASVRSAADSMEGLAADPDAPIPRMTPAEAIMLLKLHAPAVKGVGRPPGRFARPRSLAELSDSILAKLSAIEAMRGRG